MSVQYLVSFFRDTEKAITFDTLDAAQTYAKNNLKRWSSCNTLADHTDGSGCYYLYRLQKLKVVEPLPPIKNKRLEAIFGVFNKHFEGKKIPPELATALLALESEIERGEF